MINQQNIATMQQKFVIQIDEKTLKRVKPFDREELVKAYLQLFAGFSWVNWTNGHSLGRAWQTALSQCKAFCESKNKKNPAAKYLNAACNGHRKYWSQVIMTHKNRENTINSAGEKVKHLHEHGQRMIRQAMDKINLILARYNEYVLEVSHSAAMEMVTERTANAYHNEAPTRNEAMMEMGQASMQRQAPMQIAQSEQVMQSEKHPRVAMQQAEDVVVASDQQRSAVQSVPQVQRVAQPMQMAQAAKAQQQRPAVQNVPQVAQVKQKRPYVKPMAQVVQEKKPYVAPQMSVRENQFAKQVKTETQTKVASMINAQQKVQKMNMFMFGNFNQRAA